MVNVTSAYIVAIIVCAVFFLLAMLIANMIKFKPDLSDKTKRRVCFWVLAILNPIIGFALNYGIFYVHINAHSKQAAFLTAMAIAAAIALVLYIVAGVIAAKISKTGKISTLF